MNKINIKTKGLFQKALIMLGMMLSIEVVCATDLSSLSGSGTEASPYKISSLEDLLTFRDYVNEQTATLMDYTYVELDTDIDLGSIDNFEPIGNNDESSYSYFSGSFDGKGHKISNMKQVSGDIGDRTSTNLGLFGVLHNNTESATVIQNLELENIDIQIGVAGDTIEEARVGGLCGGIYNQVHILNVKVSGNIAYDDNSFLINEFDTDKSSITYTGGIIGIMNVSTVGFVSKIENCESKVNIKENISPDNTYTGGIVGFSSSNKLRYCYIARCANKGSLIAYSYIGGIVGYGKAICVEGCSNIGTVTFYDGYCGGIIGNASSVAILHCMNAGLIQSYPGYNSKLSNVGGIVGCTNAKSTNIFYWNMSHNVNVGAICLTTTKTMEYIGGLGGYVKAYVFHNISAGEVLKNGGTTEDFNPMYGKFDALSSDNATEDNDAGKGIYYTTYASSKYLPSYNIYGHTTLTGVDGVYAEDKLVGDVTGSFFNFGEDDDLRKKISTDYISGGGTGWGETAGLIESNWVYKDELMPMPNETDEALNVLASAVVRIDDDDRLNNVNHKFSITIDEVEGEQPEFSSTSGNKICKVVANSVGLVALGQDTILIKYKGMTRRIPIYSNAIDTLIFSGGNGTASSPYILTCVADLRELNTIMMKDQEDGTNWTKGKYFKLYNDIKEDELDTRTTKAKFEGNIGTNNSLHNFQGVFNGNYHSININVKADQQYNGLFEMLEGARIYNLEVNGNISGNGTMGGICGRMEDSKIDSCASHVNIGWLDGEGTATADTAGGIAAVAVNSSISNCGNNGIVRSKALSGGLIGYAKGCEIKGSMNNGSVTSVKAAGICGAMEIGDGASIIEKCANYGFVRRNTTKISGTTVDPICAELNGCELGETLNNTQMTSRIDENRIEGEEFTTDDLTSGELQETFNDWGWTVRRDGAYAIPNALHKMSGGTMMALPVYFGGYSSVHDVCDTMKILKKLVTQESETFMIDSKGQKYGYATDAGVITGPHFEFGYDTMMISLDEAQGYEKIIPVIFSSGTSKKFLSGGMGTKENPYLITKAADLTTLANSIAKNEYCVDEERNESWHKYYRLDEDIDASFSKIIGTGEAENLSFDGYFDGNGHYIRLAIDGTGEATGLFGVLSKEAEVKRLRTIGSVKGKNNTAAIAGELKESSSITVCANSATVEGTTNVGGVAGYVHDLSKVSSALNLGDISGEENVGGVAGKLEDSDLRLSANAGITKATSDNQGGVVGYYEYGGISGYLLYNCLNYGYFSSDVDNAGAIVGGHNTLGTGSVNKLYYDMQLTLSPAISGTDDQTSFYDGMTTDSLTSASDDMMMNLIGWKQDAGLYPIPSQLSALSGFTEVAVARSPMKLNTSNKYADVSVDFVVSTANNVGWKESESGKVKFDAFTSSNIDSVLLQKSGVDTMIAECSGADGNIVSKKIPIFITANLFSGGNGSESNPYKITKVADLEELEMYVNTNVISLTKRINWSDGKYFSLENDIDTLVDVIIGQPDENAHMPSFRGSFEGHGHRIALGIDRATTNKAGLFGELGSGAVIDSLTVSGKVNAQYRVGGICGTNTSGKITNCGNEAHISGDNYVGGICGFNNSTIKTSSNSGNVDCTYENAGGISGYTEVGEIEGAVNIGRIKGTNYIGGICGNLRMNSSLKAAVNGGEVNGTVQVGGICGVAYNSTVDEAINTALIKASNRQAGTITGYDTLSTVAKCFYDTQHSTDTTQKEQITGLSTSEITGNGLSSSLASSLWHFSANRYPVPQTDTIALIASSAMMLRTVDSAWNINDDYTVYGYDGISWKTNIPRINFEKEKNDIRAKLVKRGTDTVSVYTDHAEKKIAVTVQCITIHNDSTITGCDSVVFGGKTYKIDIQLTDTTKTADGCDSITGINIEILHPSDTTFLPTAYEQDSVVYTTTYNKEKTTRVFYNDTLVVDNYSNVDGCDSVVVKKFDISHAEIINKEIEPACDEINYTDDFLADVITAKADTTIKEVVKDQYLRDSIITYVKLTVNHTQYTDTVIIGQDSIVYKGIVYKESTKVSDTTSCVETGCDSITRADIRICESTYRTISKISCDWLNLPMSGRKDSTRRIEESCTIVDTIANAAGCDSIITYNITIMHSSIDTLEMYEECYQFKYQGVTYTQDVVIDDSSMNEGGCYDVERVVIKIKKPEERDTTVTSCLIATVLGKQYLESTEITDTIFGAATNGCDSIIHYTITVNQPVTHRDTLFGCDSVYVESADLWFYNDTLFTTTLAGAAANGCDSTSETLIHVCKTVREDIDVWGCEVAYYTDLNGDVQTFTEDRYLMDVELETVGNVQCMKTVRNVNIHVGTKAEITVKHEDCDSVEFRNKIYYEDAEIIDSGLTVSNCDSFTIHKIIVHKPSIGHKEVNGCEVLSYEGKSYTQDTTIYTLTKTEFGCDSTTEVRVHISMPSEVDTTIGNCNFVEYDGETFEDDTTIVRTYQNVGGCDSTVTAHIVVYKPSHTTITIDSLYTVTYNGRHYSRSTVIRDSSNVNIHGCDSIVTVKIVIENALDYPIIVNKYGYMLLCNNNIGTDKYNSYQWYKNGEPVYGAEGPYYVESDKLEGCYQVYVTTSEGSEYFSETICIEKDRELYLYPNPVERGEAITIEYDFTEEEKNGMYMDVYNSRGEKVYNDMPNKFPIQIPGMESSGYYFILITTGLDNNLGAKFIVK